MNLIYKQIIILTANLFVLSGCFVARTANVETNDNLLNAVFAGTQIDSQENSKTIAFYFRPNRTYTTKLDRSDWQTRIDGTYKITGQKLKLFPQNPDENSQEMEFQSKGQNLVYQGIALFKLNITNNIEPLFIGLYRNLESKISKNNKEAESILETSYVFDGKGNFGKDEYRKYEKEDGRVGTVAIKEKAISGTYTIQESLLKLQYNNETTTKSLFLLNTFGNAFVVLLGGELFYGMAERQETTENSGSNKVQNDQAKSKIDGLQVLKQANLAHGGAKLDNLKTLLMTKQTTYINTIFVTKIKIDLINKRIRIEDNLKDDFSIRQLDGENSWLWRKNRKMPLEVNHRIELLKYLSRGVFGLRSEELKNIAIKSAHLTDIEKNQKVVNIVKNGELSTLFFDAKNRLMTETFVEYKRDIISSNDEFKNVEGIVFPFNDTKQMGELVIQEKFIEIEVNPVFSTTDWAVPTSKNYD